MTNVTCMYIHSYRLKQELDFLMKDECQSYHKDLGKFLFKFHEPPTHPNCVAWLGGMSGLSIGSSMYVRVY